MYKVMIVDDEPIFVEYLKKNIEFLNNNCTLCAVASDGEEAIKLIEQKNPDIVFMDINMPNKTGLEVCEIMVKRHKLPRIIILTAHDEFQFAQKAIKLGVFDYLLKPFDKEELEATLRKCIQDIEKENSESILISNEASEIELYLEQTIELERTIKDKSIPLELTSDYYAAVIMRAEDTYSKEQIYSIIKDFGFTNFFYMGTYQSMYVIIHLLDLNHDINYLKNKYAEYLEKKNFEFISIGNLVGDLRDLHKSYQQAIIGIENRMQVQKQIIVFDDMQYLDDKKNIYSRSDVEVLIKYFEKSKYKEVDIMIERILDITPNKVLSFQYVIYIYYSLLTQIYEHYRKDDDNIVRHMSEQRKLLMELNMCENTQEVVEIIKNYLYEILSDCMEFQITNKNHSLVGKIDQYLLENYSEKSLNVQKISDVLFFENSYLRRIYKTYKRKTIMQSLEDLRMEKAKYLLKNTTLKLNDIAESIGFGDAFYFSRRFKLHMNLSPKEYRELEVNKK